MWLAVPATPVNPSSPAISAIARNITAQLNIKRPPFLRSYKILSFGVSNAHARRARQRTEEFARDQRVRFPFCSYSVTKLWGFLLTIEKPALEGEGTEG
jgi:hypothetical protein